MLDHNTPYLEKMHYIDAELAGHVHELDVKLQSLYGSGFSFFTLRVLAKPTTLQLIDQQHFTKTKMEYISLPSNFNAMIGISSYYCVILKFVILHHAKKTVQNGVFVFLFFLKNKSKQSVQKKQRNRIKKSGGLFF